MCEPPYYLIGLVLGQCGIYPSTEIKFVFFLVQLLYMDQSNNFAQLAVKTKKIYIQPQTYCHSKNRKIVHRLLCMISYKNMFAIIRCTRTSKNNQDPYASISSKHIYVKNLSIKTLRHITKRSDDNQVSNNFSSLTFVNIIVNFILHCKTPQYFFFLP